MYLTLSHLIGKIMFHASRAIESHRLGLEFAGSVQLQYPDLRSLEERYQHTATSPFSRPEGHSQP